MNAIHTVPPHFSKNHSNMFHLRLGLPNGLFPSGFPTKLLYEFLISCMGSMYLAHLILHELIPLITFGEAYKL